MFRFALKVLFLLLVAAAYVVISIVVIGATKVESPPQSFSRAQNEAARDAARRGESSFCGVAIPAEWLPDLAAGTTIIGVATTEDDKLAACLHRQGYLTALELSETEKYLDGQELQWWELALWGLGFVVVVGGTGFHVFRRRGSPPAARIPLAGR